MNNKCKQSTKCHTSSFSVGLDALPPDELSPLLCSALAASPDAFPPDELLAFLCSACQIH